MKKTLLVISAFALMCCEVKISPREAEAQSTMTRPSKIVRIYGPSHDPALAFDKHIVDDMVYGMFYVADGTSQTGYGVAVVNLTKDKLECEKLALELEKLRKEKQ